MIFDVLTLFPEMIENHCKYSILKRAVENKILSVMIRSRKTANIFFIT